MSDGDTINFAQEMADRIADRERADVQAKKVARQVLFAVAQANPNELPAAVRAARDAMLKLD